MAVECVVDVDFDVDFDIGVKVTVNVNARCHRKETNRPLVHGQIRVLVHVIVVEGKAIHVDQHRSADRMRAVAVWYRNWATSCRTRMDTEVYGHEHEHGYVYEILSSHPRVCASEWGQRVGA